MEKEQAKYPNHGDDDVSSVVETIFYV